MDGAVGVGVGEGGDTLTASVYMLVLGNKPLPQPTMTNQTNGVPDSILSGFFFC